MIIKVEVLPEDISFMYKESLIVQVFNIPGVDRVLEDALETVVDRMTDSSVIVETVDRQLDDNKKI